MMDESETFTLLESQTSYPEISYDADTGPAFTKPVYLTATEPLPTPTRKSRRAPSPSPIPPPPSHTPQAITRSHQQCDAWETLTRGMKQWESTGGKGKGEDEMNIVRIPQFIQPSPIPTNNSDTARIAIQQRLQSSTVAKNVETLSRIKQLKHQLLVEAGQTSTPPPSKPFKSTSPPTIDTSTVTLLTSDIHLLLSQSLALYLAQCGYDGCTRAVLSVLTDMSYQYMTRMATSWHDATENMKSRGFDATLDETSTMMLHAMGIDDVTTLTQHYDINVTGMSQRLTSMESKLKEMHSLMLRDGWKQEWKERKLKERQEWIVKREEFENKEREEENKRMKEEERNKTVATTSGGGTSTSTSTTASPSKNTAMTDDPPAKQT